VKRQLGTESSELEPVHDSGVAGPESIPLLGEEAPDEDESPYLRRQKASQPRRGRLRRRLRWVIFGVLVVLPVGLAGYFLATFLLNSPQFLITNASDVDVQGNHYVGRDEVLAAMGLVGESAHGFGMNVFRLSLEDLKKEVEQLPWVKSATIARAFPHRLSVFILERNPVAFVNAGGQLKLVDQDGMLLDLPDQANFDFPLITGLDASLNPEERQERIALFIQFMKDLSSDIPRGGWMISEVDLRDRTDARALLVQGHTTLQVHFGDRDFKSRFQSFLELLPRMQADNPEINSVDLRYRNQVIVNPGQPAAAPASPPEPQEPSSPKE
jgi:cell division protein FtsQ